MDQSIDHALLRAAHLLLLAGIALWFLDAGLGPSTVASAIFALAGLFLSVGTLRQRLSGGLYSWVQALIVTGAVLTLDLDGWGTGSSQFLITAISVLAMAAFAGAAFWVPIIGYIIYSAGLFVLTVQSEPTNLGYQIDFAVRGVVLGGFLLLVTHTWKQRIKGLCTERESVRSFGRALLLSALFPGVMLPLQLSLEAPTPGIVRDTLMGFLMLAGLGLFFYRRQKLSGAVRWGITLLYSIGFIVSLINVGSLALPVVFLSVPIAFMLMGRVYAIGISLAVVMLPLSLSQIHLFDLPAERALQALYAGVVIVGLLAYLGERIKSSEQLLPRGLLFERDFWIRFSQVNALFYVLFLVAMAPLLEEVYISQQSQFAESLLLPTGVAVMLSLFLGFLAGRSAVEHQTLRDVREKQQESIDALLAAQNRLDRVATNANVVFLNIDIKTDLITSNSLWRERWNFAEGEQVRFADFKAMMSPQAGKIFKDAIDKVLRTKAACEVTFESQRKGPNWARLHFSPQLDKFDEVVGIEITNVDITKEVLAKQELAAANAELNQTLERQREMFAVIGHELRTPVASIDMLLRDDETTPDQKLGMIGEINQGLLGVLDDLRVVVSPERVNKVSNEVVSPKKLIMRTLGPMASLLQKGGIKLNLDLGDSTQAFEFNAQALRRLVNNLVKNAVVHAGADNIWIRLESLPHQSYSQSFLLTIEDDGKGVSKQFEDQMFKAFSRGETDADGTGLGLHICKELAQLLRGTIKYQPSPKGGAAFVVEFTLDLAIPEKQLNHKAASVEAGVPEAASKASKSFDLSMKGLRVLVAEDEQLLRMLTTKQLVKKGAQVVACEDGSAALKAYRAGEFDLVLTDIMMPVMDGYGLTQALRQEGYQGPIFGVTAAVVGDETQRLLDAGANLVMEKPLRSAKLEQACSDFESLKPRVPRAIVVDDDPVTLTHLSMKLSEMGVECICYEHETEAFAALRSEHFDAIILDVHLRDRSALDLVPHIRSVTSAPVLFVTADESAETRKRVEQIKDALIFLKSDIGKLTEYIQEAV